jgi:ABC-type uncharacterized transport system fused permease/ATPase subunit
MFLAAHAPHDPHHRQVLYDRLLLLLVKVLPIVGEIDHSLVWAAIVWAVFGTVLLMVVGTLLMILTIDKFFTIGCFYFLIIKL